MKLNVYDLSNFNDLRDKIDGMCWDFTNERMIVTYRRIIDNNILKIGNRINLDYNMIKREICYHIRKLR